MKVGPAKCVATGSMTQRIESLNVNDVKSIIVLLVSTCQQSIMSAYTIQTFSGSILTVQNKSNCENP